LETLRRRALTLGIKEITLVQTELDLINSNNKIKNCQNFHTKMKRAKP
jgi:hypothetical protein